MKTYLLDILNRYNRFSENLDVKTILCNKSWLIFNDSGDKELYIFQENSSLIASINGNVTNATWQYISANKSLLISFKEQSYLLHPSFINNTIFALQQDGTERFLFMISEEQCTSFYPKSLKELNSYFEEIESKRLEEEKLQKQKLLEQQRIEQLQKIKEFNEQEQYRIREKERQEEEALVNRALEESKLYQTITIVIWVIAFLTPICLIFWYVCSDEFAYVGWWDRIWNIFVFASSGLTMPALLSFIILLPIEATVIKRYKRKKGKS